MSTLWSVDDEATAILVVEFYTNLWKRSLPRLEALWQAQLAVMKRYDPAKHAPRVKGEDPGALCPSTGRLSASAGSGGEEVDGAELTLLASRTSS